MTLCQLSNHQPRYPQILPGLRCLDGVTGQSPRGGRPAGSWRAHVHVATSGPLLAAHDPGKEVRARMSCRISHPWFPRSPLIQAEFLQVFSEWAARGRRKSAKQPSSALAALMKAGCWRGLLAGAQLWARPGAVGQPLAEPAAQLLTHSALSAAGPGLPLHCPATSSPSPALAPTSLPTPICMASLFFFTLVTHTPQWGHPAPRWGLLEFLGKHRDPGALQPYSSHR